VPARLSPHIDAGTMPRTGASGARQAARTGTVEPVCDGSGRAWQGPRASRSTRRNGLGAGAAFASQRDSAGQGRPQADLPVCRDAQARRLLSCAAQGAVPRQPRPARPPRSPPAQAARAAHPAPDLTPVCRSASRRATRPARACARAASSAPRADSTPPSCAPGPAPATQRRLALSAKVARAEGGGAGLLPCAPELGSLEGFLASKEKGEQLASWAAKVLCRQPCSCLQRCCCSRSPTGLPVTDRSARPSLP